MAFFLTDAGKRKIFFGLKMPAGLVKMARMQTPAGFTHHTARLSDVALHYVRGGSGRPVVLLHGWSQTWYEWRHVMPVLAEHYTVIAPDLRGLGDSTKPLTGYDKRTVAGDIHELVGQLGLGDVALVGHDHGAAVAYAYAARHRAEVTRLAFLEMLLMGAGGELGLDHSQGQGLWHLSFHACSGEVGEALIRGRERMYLNWFYGTFAYDRSAIDDESLDEYVRCYSAPGGLRLEYYRAFFEDAAHVKESMQQKLTIPVLALGGDSCLGSLPGDSMQALAQHVQAAVIPRCGHFIPDERPDALLEHLLPFLAA
jgi:pimeloyl-ACP methyl ester carboxylesterase